MYYFLDSLRNADGSISFKPKYDYEASAVEKIVDMQQSLIGCKLNSKIIFMPTR